MSAESADDLAQLALLGEAVDRLQDVAIFVWDEDRNYVAANDAACALIGRTREELLRMKVGDMTPNRGAPHFEEVQHQGRVHSGSSRIDRDDAPIEIDWITARTTIAGLPYFVSVCTAKEPS